jgi:hypothetical protein
MTERREELLQARVDGELTSDQRVELERLLAEDESTRLRAGELEALVETLTLLGQVDPPTRVMRAVIDHVHHNAPGALNQSEMTATGGLMRTKVLWGLAAAAGIVLAVLAYTGFPPESGGSEGAIGAAKRYQAGQIAASDVKLGDQAAQDFLQSDLFDRLRRDETVVAALSNPAIAKALADPALMRALGDTQLRLRLTDAAFGRALSDEAFRKALGDPAFGKALNDLELGKALTDVDLRKALTDPDLRKALTDVDLRKALTDADLVKALNDPSLAKALSSVDLQQALKSNGLSAALRSPQFGEAMRRGIR